MIIKIKLASISSNIFVLASVNSVHFDFLMIVILRIILLIGFQIVLMCFCVSQFKASKSRLQILLKIDSESEKKRTIYFRPFYFFYQESLAYFFDRDALKNANNSGSFNDFNFSRENFVAYFSSFKIHIEKAIEY